LIRLIPKEESQAAVWPMPGRAGVDTVYVMGGLSRSRAMTLLDVAAGVFVAAVTEWQVFSAREHLGTHVAGPRWLTVPLPLLIALPLLWRRRVPLLACALVMAGIAAQALASGDSPEGLQLIVLWVLVPFSVAAHSDRRRGALGLGLTLAAFGAYAAENPDITSGRTGDIWAGAFFLILAIGSWLAGAVLHARRERGSLEEHARLLEREARLAVGEERSRIARELHDIVSHNLSVVVVQAAGARAQAGQDATETSTLEKIERSGREALVEMRRLLGVLRRDDDQDEVSPTPTPGIGELPRLADRLRAAGLEIEVKIAGDCAGLPPAVDLSAYRIVQEALTNTLKHAGCDARAAVRITREPDAITIQVADDGAGRPPGNPSGTETGHGLIGIRERAAVFGGEVRAGARPEGGFSIHARLPLQASARR
jgi:signal transduction histidine kinase